MGVTVNPGFISAGAVCGAPMDSLLMRLQLSRRKSRPRRGRARPALIGAGVMVGLILALGATILIFTAHQETLAAAERQLNTLALGLSEETDRGFQAAELVQSGFVDALRQDGVCTQVEFAREMASFGTHQDMMRRLIGLPHIDALSVIDQQGKMLNTSNAWPVPDVDVSDRAFFKALRQNPGGGSYITEPIRDRVTGRWMILISRVFTAQSGEPLGFVDALMELAAFETFYSRLSINPGMSVSLFRRDGVLLARFPHMDPEIGKRFGPNPEFNGLLMALDGRGVQRRSMIDGQQRLISPHSVAHFPLVVAVTATTEAVLLGW
jgi:hypothetical protein